MIQLPELVLRQCGLSYNIFTYVTGKNYINIGTRCNKG